MTEVPPAQPQQAELLPVAQPRSPLPPPREPRFTIWKAISAHPAVVLLCLLGSVGLALAYVSQREPEYSATSRLALLRVDVSQPGALAGFATAAEALAETYSRAVTSSAVVAEVATRTHLTRAEVRASLKSALVPQTPVFRITGESSTKAQAIELANVASVALRNYIGELNRENPDGRRLYRELGRSESALERRRAVRDIRNRDFERDPSGPNRAALARARAAANTALARAQALRTSYAAAVGAGTSTERVQIINPAESATSDRNSMLQLALLVSVVGGLALGIGIAAAMLAWRPHTFRRSSSRRRSRSRSRRRRRSRSH